MGLYSHILVCVFFMIYVAVQMWVLGRYLPILVGDCVPRSDEKWKNFLTLEIMDLLVAPSISTDELAYLKFLIEEHHSSFAELYPNASITPKFHYMIHLSCLTLQ